jgi:NagD protein
MNKKGFLIDMDGVIYKGTEVVDGAQQFINNLSRFKIPFMFITNNSQRTPRDISTKLQRLGFEVDEHHIYTSALATAEYMAKQIPGGTAFAVGEGGLLTALHEFGYAIVDSAPDYVVIGEGRTMTLENMEKAVQFVFDGAKLLATNLDPNCPTQLGGVRPGCGAFVKLIEEATGKKCFSLGKPSPIIFRGARKRMGLRAEEVVMVGDTMDTDIMGAVQLGYRAILVLSGGTKREDLRNFAFQPDVVVNSVADIDVNEFVCDDGK